MQVKSFEFSPFSENTYVLFDSTLEAVIIDPGCLDQREKLQLSSFITDNKLQVKALILTHAHLDHVFGAAYVKRTFGVGMGMHKLEIPVLSEVENRCKLWGLGGYEPTEADYFIEDGEIIKVGNFELEVIHVPGHAPGHVAYICHEHAFVIGGDCLFKQSIGRTDFPLCSHEELIKSIKTKFFKLPDHYIVYAGHMEPTTIGFEKQHNPFLK